jgi:vacuolar-type H+-ATPase subunit E/Vma4
MFKGDINKKGRPKGSPNKATNKIRESIKKIVEGNISQVEDDLSKLEPKDRLKFTIDLMAFVLPKLKTIELVENKGTDGFAPVVIQISEPINLGNGVNPETE